MKIYRDGRVQDKILDRIERQEKKKAFERERFLRFKLQEVHSKLYQKLLVDKVIETDDPASISDSLLNGLRKALKSTEFDFKYFVAPLRDLVPRPNPYSLYMTQYLMEVLIDSPAVIEIYGTDLEIYKKINEVISKIQIQFENTEQEVLAQVSSNKSLVPGSRDYEIAVDQLLRKKVGDPLQ
ncbi:DUF507 family protein [Thermodesulfobacteriota bacterium]